MNYVTFNASDLSDFRNVILTDVLLELMTMEDFEERQIYAIGAMDGDVAVGALVLQLPEEPQAIVHSLYVLPDYRDQGIGSELLRQAIGVALQVYPYRYQVYSLGLMLEYVLPLKQADRMDAFLIKNGFTALEDAGTVVTLNAEGLAEKLPYAGFPVDTLSHAAGEDVLALEAQMEDAGINSDPAYCTVLGDRDDPDAMMIVHFGADSDFYVGSVVAKNDVTLEAYRALLGLCVHEISKDYPDFVLIAEDTKNACTDLWLSLAEENGTVARRCVAVAAMTFEE